MEMQGLISIIIPVYNAQKYLENCIKSIMRQTYHDYELILVDDGSTDESWVMIQKYVNISKKIKGFRKENGGPNSARKMGVEMASGEYVMFVDADDYVDHTICYKLLHTMIMQNVDIVLSKIVKVLDDTNIDVVGKWPERKYMGNYVAENLIDLRIFYKVNIWMGLYGNLYKIDRIKKVFQEIDLRIDFAEDYACLLSVLLDSDYVYFLDEALYYYRQNDSSITHKHLKSSFESQKHMYQFVTKQLKKRNASFILYRQLEWMIVRNLLLGGYDAFKDKEYLYPFKNIKRCSNIILYGAGVFGGEVYAFIRHYQICNVVLWVDQNWKKYQEKGIPVSQVEEIYNTEYDYIIVAILKLDIAEKVKETLIEQGIDENKIEIIDQTLISYKELPKKFWE